MIIRSLLNGLGIAFIFLCVSAAADTYTITFDETGLHSPTASENWGTIIDNEYGSDNLINYGGIDVTFWAQTSQSNFSNSNNFSSNNANLFLTLFNSDATFSTEDPDLIVGQGNLAVIHERNHECSLANNRCNDPDDRYRSGSPHGGFVFINFSQAVNLHSIGLADIESGSNQRGKIRFYNSAGATVQNAGSNWTMMDVTGNKGYTTQEFNFASNITYMVLRMQGSGGFKNLTFSSTNVVPEPSSFLIFLMSLALLYFGHHRKNAS